MTLKKRALPPTSGTFNFIEIQIKNKKYEMNVLFEFIETTLLNGRRGGCSHFIPFACEHYNPKSRNEVTDITTTKTISDKCRWFLIKLYCLQYNNQFFTITKTFLKEKPMP